MSPIGTTRRGRVTRRDLADPTPSENAALATVRPAPGFAFALGVRLREPRRDCANKRTEYLIARQVYSEVTRLAVVDRSALERELRDAILDYYAAHGALHEKLRERGDRQGARLH